MDNALKIYSSMENMLVNFNDIETVHIKKDNLNLFISLYSYSKSEIKYTLPCSSEEEINDNIDLIFKMYKRSKLINRFYTIKGIDDSIVCFDITKILRIHCHNVIKTDSASKILYIYTNDVKECCITIEVNKEEYNKFVEVFNKFTADESGLEKW